MALDFYFAGITSVWPMQSFSSSDNTNEKIVSKILAINRMQKLLSFLIFSHPLGSHPAEVKLMGGYFGLNLSPNCPQQVRARKAAVDRHQEPFTLISPWSLSPHERVILREVGGHPSLLVWEARIAVCIVQLLLDSGELQEMVGNIKRSEVESTILPVNKGDV